MMQATEQIIEPHIKDLGGFEARRSLPQRDRTLVGPFIFFDHLGPATFPPGKGVDVRPHPHINLATVTYLFEGTLMHRDSLGVGAGNSSRCGELDDGGKRDCTL